MPAFDIRAGFLAFALPLAAGCGAEPVANPSVQPPTTRPALAPAAPLDTARLVSQGAKTLTYATSAHLDPEVVVHDPGRETPTTGKSWWVRSYKGSPSSGAPAEREVSVTIAPNGDLVENEEIDRLDKVEVVYTPAIILIPHGLGAHNPAAPGHVQEVRMVVHPLNDRTKVRAHSPATCEITYTGDEQITTPAGEFTAHKVTSVLTAKLSAAHTVDTSEQWWADGIGLVAEKEHEVTKVLGATVRDNTTTLLLKSSEKPR